MMKKLALFILLLIPTLLLAGDGFFTYYNSWCMGTDAQWSLGSPWYISTKTYASQLGNTSHVIIFMGHEIVKSDYAPYLSITKDYADAGGGETDSIDFLWNGVNNPGSGYASWVSRGGIEALRDSLHAKGKYLLVCIQAVNSSIGFNYVLADSARTEVFTKAFARYCNTHNFDGGDLNVENSQTYTNAELVRFFRILRRNMPSPKLITTVPPVTQWSAYTGAISYIDYVLPQCYAYTGNNAGGQNVVFLKAPITKNAAVGLSDQHSLIDWGPDQWYAQGWPKSKIVILLSNEALPFIGGDTILTTPAIGFNFNPDTLAYIALAKGGRLVWYDDIGHNIQGTATSTISFFGKTANAGDKFIVNILSDRNIDSVVAWAKRKGYSNFGLYDVSTDTRTPNTIKNPRHAHLSSILDTTYTPPSGETTLRRLIPIRKP
jgi:hypothetical protein